METKSDIGCAVVTGGSRGIGRAVVLRLAEDGFDIAFCSRREDENAKEVTRAVQATGRQCLFVPCDVSSREEVKTFVKQAEAELGPITAVVNSAGIVRDAAFVTMRPEDWHAVVDTNLTGTFNVCHAAAFGMLKRRRGSIVNLSSVSGIHGNPGQSNYSATKAGIIALSATMAKEMGPYGIRVNVVAPGLIETDMLASLKEARRDETVKSVALRRIGEPEHVAAAVSFLLSDGAAYITGHTLRVDGGLGV